MESYGRYRNTPVYKLSVEEFLELEDTKQSVTSCIYLIEEDGNLIFNGEVFAKFQNQKVVTLRTRMSYIQVYAKRLREMRAEKAAVEAAKASAEVARVKATEAMAQPKSPQVMQVSQRETVAALAAKGNQKLRNLEGDANASLAKLKAEGEEKLAEVEKRGVQIARAVKNKKKKAPEKGADVEA